MGTKIERFIEDNIESRKENQQNLFINHWNRKGLLRQNGRKNNKKVKRTYTTKPKILTKEVAPT